MDSLETARHCLLQTCYDGRAPLFGLAARQRSQGERFYLWNIERSFRHLSQPSISLMDGNTFGKCELGMSRIWLLPALRPLAYVDVHVMPKIRLWLSSLRCCSAVSSNANVAVFDHLTRTPTTLELQLQLYGRLPPHQGEMIESANTCSSKLRDSLALSASQSLTTCEGQPESDYFCILRFKS